MKSEGIISLFVLNNFDSKVLDNSKRRSGSVRYELVKEYIDEIKMWERGGELFRITEPEYFKLALGDG